MEPLARPTLASAPTTALFASDSDNESSDDSLERVPTRVMSTTATSTGPNFLFYSGSIKSKPMGNYIHEIHSSWFYNYSLLESHHGFIQWLFPVFESSGVNWDAQSLTKSEAKLIREDFELATKFIRSYQLMLNFYGMVLVDEKTGKVARHPQIWQSRYWNLLSHQHNFLRINRILACLGHMGFHKWRKGFLAHLEKEIYKTEELKHCKMSFERFWKKNLEVDSPEFLRKTLERPEDRTDSVFFEHMQSNSELYQAYLARKLQFEQELAELAEEANQREVAVHQQRLERELAARQRQIEKTKAAKAAKQPSLLKRFLSKSSPGSSKLPASPSASSPPTSPGATVALPAAQQRLVLAYGNDDSDSDDDDEDNEDDVVESDEKVSSDRLHESDEDDQPAKQAKPRKRDLESSSGSISSSKSKRRPLNKENDKQ